ncbi:MAG: hypothetical protein ACUVXJ_05220 [Phycisphaerae bacterium]
MKANSEAGLQERFRRHIDVLAELIGERNSAHPTAIEAAREYLHRELREVRMIASRPTASTRWTWKG